jgi:hypothetical protein
MAQKTKLSTTHLKHLPLQNLLGLAQLEAVLGLLLSLVLPENSSSTRMQAGVRGSISERSLCAFL